MRSYLDELLTPSVLAVQQAKGAAGIYAIGQSAPAALDAGAIAHITASDSFYMATVSESDWPYVQHRGGDTGFVKILGPTTIGWAERSGNRQYLGTGNIAAGSKVAAIFVDYPTRTRIKIRGTATYHPEPSPELIESLGASELRVDGAVTIEVAATDWNCPKYITPRFTSAQVETAVQPLRDRIAELEAQLAAPS
ncbi:MAG: putative pyridoxine 5'-phosphate oxidase superfamily flavin-nucleotide-binding protein [Candidatus Aldehydirespiratoraceae bacterium]|jgi:predicted pyridoxine 5'-phosphate oxidase superfamily flavin-nucleotide-binding protein